MIGHFLKRCVGLGRSFLCHAGVVNQNINATKVSFYLCHQSAGGGAVGEVGGVAPCIVLGVAQGLHAGVDAHPRGANRDARPQFGQQLGAGKTNAGVAATAGDQGDLALQ